MLFYWVMKILYRYNVKIDFKNRTAKEELRRAVRIIYFVNLKPHSEAIVPIRLPKAFGPSGTVLLEPLHCNMREGYWTARTVVKPEGFVPESFILQSM